MFVKSKLADFFIRTGLGLLLGLVFGWVLSEVSFQFLGQKETVEREPHGVHERSGAATPARSETSTKVTTIPSIRPSWLLALIRRPSPGVSTAWM